MRLFIFKKIYLVIVYLIKFRFQSYFVDLVPGYLEFAFSQLLFLFIFFKFCLWFNIVNLIFLNFCFFFSPLVWMLSFGSNLSSFDSTENLILWSLASSIFISRFAEPICDLSSFVYVVFLIKSYLLFNNQNSNSDTVRKLISTFFRSLQLFGTCTWWLSSSFKK